MSTRGWLSIFSKKASETVQAGASTGRDLDLYGVPGIRRAPPSGAKTKPALLQSAAFAKLVIAFDATSSREVAWQTAVPLTDTVLTTVQGDRLRVALAWHRANRVTFTDFASDAGRLRDRAAGVTCKAGYTQLLPILTRVLQTEGVGTVVYIGDTFEEREGQALKIADALARRSIRLIILHDHHSRDVGGAEIFQAMAERTGGCVLPFDASAISKLKELLSAVAVLAIGGKPALAAKQESMPAARLLIEHLDRKGKAL